MQALCSVGDNGDVDDDNGPLVYHMSLDIRAVQHIILGCVDLLSHFTQPITFYLCAPISYVNQICPLFFPLLLDADMAAVFLNNQPHTPTLLFKNDSSEICALLRVFASKKDYG